MFVSVLQIQTERFRYKSQQSRDVDQIAIHGADVVLLIKYNKFVISYYILSKSILSCLLRSIGNAEGKRICDGVRHKMGVGPSEKNIINIFIYENCIRDLEEYYKRESVYPSADGKLNGHRFCSAEMLVSLGD